MKIKTAAVFLLITSIYWTLIVVYTDIKLISSVEWDTFNDYDKTGFVIQRLFFLVPLSVVMFSISIIANKSKR